MLFLPTGRRERRIIGLILGCLTAVAASATDFQQPGFSESVVFTGLTNPTAMRFLPDGRVLVAEKSGLLKIFPNLTTNTYTIVGDLRVGVHNFWDRGLLGLAVPPGFDPQSPDEWRRYVYVLYTHNAAIGGTAPKWPGAADGFSDTCPGSPAGPGATGDGCVVSGRLSRLPANGDNWTEAGEEEVLLEDWCQQFPSHSTGALDFGADEKLYVSGGDGASFGAADWGQFGGTVQIPGNPGTYYTPANPCADPPFPLGTKQTKPTARGGALRSQSPRRPPGEARLLNGSILRVDPATGDALSDNPLFSSTDANEQRILAYGFRNPFRMIVRPGTNEVYVADVGWSTWEEINRIPDLSSARNFGWPCFEGNGAVTQYGNLDICPTKAQTVLPLFTYNHSLSAVPGDGCLTGSSSIAGMAFYQGGSNYPAGYENALFFSDYSRKCMWVMFPGTDGNPDPASASAFASSALGGPVDLQIGPDGDLYYVEFTDGRVMRIHYGLSAAATANPTSGVAPLQVDFDGSGSVPAQAGDVLTYAWDLDGDGEYDDSSEISPSHTYTTPANLTARLRVSDDRGAVAFSDPIPISAGNTAPTAVIDEPLSSLLWKVNDTITFGGHGDDAQEAGGTVPVAKLEWTIRIQHCPSNCHAHVYQTFSGVAGGSFPAPDHEYPSYLEIELTATDTQGLSNTTTVAVHPETVALVFQTTPPGLQIAAGTATGVSPLSLTAIRNSAIAVDPLAPQGAFPNVWEFSAWSDGGAEQHTITASSAGTYTATYTTHADLSISSAATPEPVGAGAAVTWTLNVANSGPSQANSVSVTHTLPAGAVFQSASGAGWACAGSSPVTCTLPALGIGAAGQIQVVATAPADAGVMTASSAVAAATADAAAANNSSSSISNVFARADLSITQSGAPAAICPGQPISYTLNVSNAGPSPAASVSVVDALPAGASLVSAAGQGWSCGGTTTLTCTRPSLGVGAAPAITVAIDAPATAGPATSAASVSSATNDPSSVNDSSAASTTVNATPPPPATGGGGDVCIGDTLQLTAATVPGAAYAWTGPNGFVSSAQNPTIPNVTLAASGTYSVKVTVSGCESAAATTDVLVGTPPELPELTAPLSVAVGATGLSGSVADHTGSSYAWTLSAGGIESGQGTSAITFAAADPGTTMSLSVVETHATCSSPAATWKIQVDFLDVPPPHMFHDFVNTIARAGVTVGCGTGNFCPGAPNTREQMAVFVLKSKFGKDHTPPAAVGLFPDVPVDSPFAPWVEELSTLHITAGCGGGQFCPQQPVTRAQMAVFLLKTLLGYDYVPPAATGTLFGDVPADSVAADWVEDLFHRGLTGGCQASPLLFCPSTPVTRGQMAVLLVRTFGL